MGNVENLDQNNPLNNEKLEYVEEQYVDGIGQVHIYRRAGSDNYIMSSLLSQEASDLQTSALERRIKLNHPHLQQALGIDNKVSYQGRRRFFFEFCFLTLDSLIAERIGTIQLFPEEDLLALLKGVLSVLAYLQDKGITHGDIHPTSIYFDTKSGAFKIYDQELIGQRASGFVLALQKSKFSFLSPELITAMRQGQYSISNDILFKSDVFALAMSILQAGCLRPSTECYDKNYSILAPIVNERLQFIEQYYSQELLSYLQCMLEYDMRKRPDSSELWLRIINDKSHIRTNPTKGNLSPDKGIILLKNQIPYEGKQGQQQEEQHYVQQGAQQAQQIPQQNQLQQQQQFIYPPQQNQIQQIPQITQQIVYTDPQGQIQQPLNQQVQYVQPPQDMFLSQQYYAPPQQQQQLPQQKESITIPQQPIQEQPYYQVQYVQPRVVTQVEQPQTQTVLTQKNSNVFVSQPPQQDQQQYAQQIPVQQQVQLIQPQLQPQQQIIYVQPQHPDIQQQPQPQQVTYQVPTQQLIAQSQPYPQQQIIYKKQLPPQQQQQQQLVLPPQSGYPPQQPQQIRYVQTLPDQRTQQIQVVQQPINQQQPAQAPPQSHSSNLQQLKEEIARSKEMIENYQKSFQNQMKQPPSASQPQQNTQPNSTGDAYQSDQGNSLSLEERIKQVIARSQAIRENFN